jgi:hypothetical protein
MFSADIVLGRGLFVDFLERVTRDVRLLARLNVTVHSGCSGWVFVAERTSMIHRFSDSLIWSISKIYRESRQSASGLDPEAECRKLQ